MTRDDANPLPDSCAVAFKEWSGVCEALERGLQAITLRKGGIAEGLGRFVPEHPVFWLYPTRVHQAEQGLRLPELAHTGRPAGVAEEEVELCALARVERVGLIERPELLADLEPFHVWTAETVEKRFRYRYPGLWVLGVRVYHRAGPWRVAVTPEHLGCKTWVPLDPALSTDGLRPVLTAAEFNTRMDRLQQILGRTGASS
jgi:hypothetical protein